MFKKIGALLAAVVASVTVVTLGATEIASAWSPPTVAGVATCITNNDGGVTDWSILWTATNNENDPFNTTTSISNPAGYAPPSYFPSNPGQLFTRTEVLPISTTSESEQVTQIWYTDVPATPGFPPFIPPTPAFRITHDTRLSNTATVWKPRTCLPTLVYVDVSFQDPNCENQNTAAVIGADDSPAFSFTVTGSVEPGGYVTVTATANPGFTLGEGTYQWSHEFSYEEDCRVEVTPVEPTLDVKVECGVTDTYTIPNVDGVIYSIDGVQVEAGTYPLADGEEVTITAVPADGYKFDTEVWTDETSEYSWTFTGSEVEVCTTLITPVAPGITVNVDCGVLDTVTVFAQQGAIYSLDAGNYPLAAGVSVTINATPAAGYTFAEGAVTEWTFTGSEVPTCVIPPVVPPIPPVVPETPVVPEVPVIALPRTGNGTDTALLAGIILAAGAALTLTGRRKKVKAIV